MKKQICHFYPIDVNTVYAAYDRAAGERFGKDCVRQPYHTIRFGLNFSLKYNMNGGHVQVSFMPVQGGTAVCVEYSVAQLMGARCGAHDRDLSEYVRAILGVAPMDTPIPAGEIQNYAAYAPTASVATVQPIQPPVQAPSQQPIGAPDPGAVRFCTRCGERSSGGNFCAKCGNKLN